MTRLRYSYRFYPTDVQREELARLFGCVRVVYNWGIDCARQARADGEKLPSYGTLSSLLTELKRSESYSWLAEVSCVPLQQSLHHLRKAFKNMFGCLWQAREMKSMELSQQGEHGGVEVFVKSYAGVIGASGALINSCQAGQGALSASAEAKNQCPDEEDRIEGGSLSFDDSEGVCQAFDDAIGQRELEFVEHLGRIVESHGFPGLRAT